jgi:hypothetical protein
MAEVKDVKDVKVAEPKQKIKVDLEVNDFNQRFRYKSPMRR